MGARRVRPSDKWQDCTECEEPVEGVFESGETEFDDCFVFPEVCPHCGASDYLYAGGPDSGREDFHADG